MLSKKLQTANCSLKTTDYKQKKPLLKTGKASHWLKHIQPIKYQILKFSIHNTTS